MNNTFFKLTLGLSLTVAAFTANAQKNYTEGVIVYSTNTASGATESKISFRGDSSSSSLQAGPATIKLITTTKHTYFAILVDVPVASMKKAAVLTPDELDQASEEIPKLTFTTTTETKQINGYNCKKVTAKDDKSGTDVELWVTNDISAPANTISQPFAGAGGFPVQFTTNTKGQKVDVTLKSIAEQKIPAGTFGIPAGYDRITYDELKAMRGGR
jgi:hypothetical protein